MVLVVATVLPPSLRSDAWVCYAISRGERFLLASKMRIGVASCLPLMKFPNTESSLEMATVYCLLTLMCKGWRSIICKDLPMAPSVALFCTAMRLTLVGCWPSSLS